MVARPRALKIALVRPPLLQMKGNLSTHGAILPLGLAYVAAVLREEGHDVQVIDAPGEAMDRVRDVASVVGTLRMTGLSPAEMAERLPPDIDLIGVTHMFLHEWPAVREFAALARGRAPRAAIVLGGENATSFWPWIFRQSDVVDYCVLGEGERPMAALARSLARGEDPAGLPGVVCRSRGPRQEARLAPRETEPDRLPRPAWDLFPVESYLAARDSFGVHRGRTMPMLATRGCPYRCTFCSSERMWTTRYATRDPAAVVAEIQDYVRHYRVGNIDFCDLTAIVRKEWVVEFCGLLERSGLAISWQLPGGTRSEALDEEVLRLLRRTGCRNITYAPESGSPRLLKVMRKMVRLPRMLECVSAARRAGIVSRVNIIIGHPEERLTDVLHSYGFLLRAALRGCQDAAVMIFSPYPGSKDFAALLERGQLEINEEYTYLALARSGLSSRTYSPCLGTRALVLCQYVMLISFYALAYLSRPWRIVALVKSFVTGRESTQLDQLLRTRFKRRPARAPAAAAAAVTEDEPIVFAPRRGAAAPDESEARERPAERVAREGQARAAGGATLVSARER